MVADIVPDMEVDMVADMEVDKVADNKKNEIDINMEIQFGERVGHGVWSIVPKRFRPEAIPGLLIFKALRVYS